jgi:hypothetical protein
MGTGAALGAAGGAAAAGMAGHHHDHNRGVDERGMGNTGMGNTGMGIGNERGMGMGNERGMGIERGMENERGMGNTGMVSSSWLQLRFLVCSSSNVLIVWMLGGGAWRCDVRDCVCSQPRCMLWGSSCVTCCDHIY